MEKKSWFVLEPYIYVCVKNEKVLFYNTLDGISFVYDDPIIVEIAEKLTSKKYNGLIDVDETLLADNFFCDFTQNLRSHYFADLLPARMFKHPPVQFYPHMTFLRSVEKLKEMEGRSIGENVKDYIHKVIFLLIDKSTDAAMQYELIKNVLDQVVGAFMFFIELDIDDAILYPELEVLLSNLKAFNLNITIRTREYASLSQEQIQLVDKVIWEINADSIQENLLKKACEDDTVYPVFLVKSSDDLDVVDVVVNKYDLQSYNIIPVYDSSNYDFIRANTFVVKEDFNEDILSMKEIHAHMAVNVNYFGKLYIHPNGDVYSSKYSPIVGNVYSKSILNIVVDELEGGYSWLKIRDDNKCSQCLYQWLCPSPGDLNVELNRSDLCMIQTCI